MAERVPEREDERHARELLERQLGVQLELTDLGGKRIADYRFVRPDGRVGVVEVTSVTNPDRKVNDVAWSGELGPFPVDDLRRSWMVFLPESARAKGVRSRIHSALKLLEAEGKDSFDRHRPPVDWTSSGARIAWSPGGRALAAAEADRANAYDEGDGAVHLSLATHGSFVAKGSDASVTLIFGELAAKPDNYDKLREATGDEKHLFVWLDGQTDYEISRPLMDDPAQQYEHFRLPTGDPDVEPVVDVLWIVHRGSMRGWFWSRGSGWSSVGD
ncbi:hypothetical protein [Ornithinicoccus hortensis]|uniref:Uncharacterized protein n=1 Tax=Ornithinicoccus hortensis TaxID=82346 RepID=A0A542YR65_9MICO|nr:hypothetical protein [Ornithinicoccus hortensis]TQL50561.1 hypothetical protein FB467_1673 [Ornithinicoccus hortensis]